MVSWFAKVEHDPDPDLPTVLAACEFFDKEYLAAVHEVDIDQLRGMRIDEAEKRLPGIIGFRYHQLEEINAIVGYLEIRLTAIKGMRRRHYLEHYNRALTPTTAEKYVEADEDVLKMAILLNHTAMTRNKFVALSKQHNYLHYQLVNITNLLVAGMVDAVL
jgi:hypothetical protein